MAKSLENREYHGKVTGKSWENHWKIMGISWHNHWKIMEISWQNHWKIMGKSLENHGDIMAKSLENHGNIMAKSLENHGKITGKSWKYHGKITGKSWENHWKIMGISWQNHGNIMAKSLENHGKIVETWSPAKSRPVATWPCLAAPQQQAARSSEDTAPCGAPSTWARGVQHVWMPNWRYLPYIRIYKAYFSGLCKGISPQNMARNMVLTYLHFRILKFPLIKFLDGQDGSKDLKSIDPFGSIWWPPWGAWHPGGFGCRPAQKPPKVVVPWRII